ncbi:integrase arm-type DNA-binding domain-containing protein [Mitsuaria sp. WAJ17]|uniref:tyrosine-type recombinase/integrase n=1 Tax=Mitsuaria sp. WAJ17 TaxID=2761452 RepID=UPI001601909A|nr:integrase arm-type DNA-binding domain-containing protein [Mitsuaria sp. WAJ17]MBB2485719.1 integrase arm-type DNA-binding domain-containing protein [Mitsuaria sp. WAJ17]
MAASDLLTDKAIRAALKAAAVEAKARKISDGGGLVLDVRPTGAGWWRLRYWLEGKERMLSLGTYPDTSLAQARVKRDEARRLVADGQDPSAVRQEAKAEAQRKRQAERLADAGLPPEGSFEAVAREWLKTVHEVKVSAGHAERTRIRLEQDAFPWLGRRPIAEIEAPELLQALRKVEARGAVETAHRIKDACGQVFRYGIATGACSRNPAADLRDALQPVQTSHHAAIVDPVQVGKLLRDMHDYQGHAVTRAALGLSALLLLRPGELRHMEWAWLDLDAAMLTVPAEVMKRKKADKADGPPHLVPLASQAVAILEALHPLTGSGRYVFPALTSKQRCMSENTVRSALRRLGYGNDDMTAHGFRATARTMIAERLSIAPEVIEAQLAHAVADSLGRAYNRTQYLDQRKAMMQAWADYLDCLRKGAEVVPIKGKAA